MDQQISERVSTLDTEVAVIQSTYVRKDELAEFREEMGVGFAKTETGFAKASAKTDLVYAELSGKIDLVRTALNARIDSVHTELSTNELGARIDAGFARLDTKIAQSTTMLLKWIFASQISVAAMFIAAIKYL